MGLQRGDGAGQGVDLQRRRVGGQAAGGHGVEHERQRGDVVEVGVGEQHVVDLGHLVEREVAHAGAGVDQHIGVEQKGGGAAVSGDGARTAEYANPHGWCLLVVKSGEVAEAAAAATCYLVSKRVLPSQAESKGNAFRIATRSQYRR